MGARRELVTWLKAGCTRHLGVPATLGGEARRLLGFGGSLAGAAVPVLPYSPACFARPLGRGGAGRHGAWLPGSGRGWGLEEAECTAATPQLQPLRL